MKRNNFLALTAVTSVAAVLPIPALATETKLDLTDAQILAYLNQLVRPEIHGVNLQWSEWVIARRRVRENGIEYRFDAYIYNPNLDHTHTPKMYLGSSRLNSDILRTCSYLNRRLAYLLNAEHNTLNVKKLELNKTFQT